MSQRILITGITSLRNHGVEALVKSTVEQLRPRLSNPVFTILDRAPEYDRHQFPADDVQFSHDYSIRPLYAGRLRKILGRCWPGSDRHARATFREIESADLVIASGGDVFCSEYGHRSLLSHLQPLKIAQKRGIPTLLHAQSIGPFSNTRDREAFLEVALKTQAVTVRETASHEYLIHGLKMPEAQCHLVADPAFLLSQGSPEAGKALFDHLCYRPENPTVALGVSQAICHWMQTSQDRHLQTWLDIIRWLRSELDANIILVPHVHEISPQNDDQVLATELLRCLEYDPAVRLAGGALSACEFKAIIARCDFLVAERMHAAIAGLSTAVPTLVVGYSIKAKGILTDLLGDPLALEHALISIEDFLQPGRGLAQVQSAWAARDQLSRRLQEGLPRTQQRAALAFDVIQRVLERGNGGPLA